jgi:Flp pilus assembly protein TadG
MAIVLPVLLMLVLGTVELGLAFRSYLTASSAASAGSRMLALMGNDEDADCEALAEVAIALATGDALPNLVDVQIFEAHPPTGGQLATNTYTYTGGDPTDCDTGWSGSPANWNPIDRNVTVGSTPLDIGGVKVTIDHGWVTGFPPFTGSFQIEETTLTRLEPEAFE